MHDRCPPWRLRPCKRQTTPFLMPMIKTFEDLEAWQKARELTREIYVFSKKGSFAKDYGLRDQIRRACVSIMSNIAEGFERNGDKEFFQFVSVAKGSSGEVRAQLYVALDAASKKISGRQLRRVASDPGRAQL